MIDNDHAHVVEPREGTLKRYISVIRRDWWIFLLAALLCGVLGLGYSALVTPRYESTAVLYVTSATDSDNQSAYQGSLASQQRVASYAQLIRSDVIVSEAIENAGLDMSVPEAQEALSASSSPGTVLLSVTSRTVDPTASADLANGVAEAMTSYVDTLETPNGGGSPLAKLTVVSPATPSSSAVSPNYSRNVLLGLVMGAFIGLSLLFLRDRFDSRLRSEADVEQALGVPALAAIPDDEKVANRPLIDFHLGSGATAEGYRKLRANLAFVRVDDPPKIIVISSPEEAEGKSTTAANLASALAESGNRVVLVDGDLRRPRVSTIFGVSNAVGLTNYLTREVSLRDTVQESAVRGVDVVGSGPTPPNAAELLESHRAKDALKELRDLYDYVIVDAPPILPIADSIILGQSADAVLLVVRANRTGAAQARHAHNELRTAHISLLGVVLNRTTRPLGGYGKYSYYRSDVPDGSDRVALRASQ